MLTYIRFYVKIRAKHEDGYLLMEDFLLKKLTAFTSEELAEYDKMAMGWLEKENFTISDARLTRGKSELLLLPHTRRTASPSHKHTFVEIMIVLSGSITHTVGGEAVRLSSGDMLFLNRHVSHSIDEVGEGDLAVNVIMTSEFLSSLAAELCGTVFTDFLEENAKSNGAGVYLHFRTVGKKQIENLIENLLFELTEYKSSTAILTRSVSLLFHYLSLKSKEVLIAGNTCMKIDEVRKSEILEYIKSNCRTATLTELSSKLYVSTPYLSKIIKGFFGKTFKELLVEERVRRAVELLTKTELPIGDIIQSLGYENHSYFHREFKRRTGTTPRALRCKGAGAFGRNRK